MERPILRLSVLFSAGVPSAERFVTKTLAAVIEAAERSIFSAESGRLPGLLQALDPRAKLLGAAMLLLAVGLLRSTALILFVYLGALLLGKLSLLRLTTLMRGVWAGVPLMTALVALPAVFAVPGHPMLAISMPGGMNLVVSDNGLLSAVRLVVRVAASVTVVLVVILTTQWADLLRALRVLGVPESFVVTLGITYRYLFLLLHIVSGVFLARASRTVGQARGIEGRRWVAAVAGNVVNKSFRISEEVYLAMVSRGFVGEVRTLSEFRMTDRDWLAITAVTACVAGLIAVDRGLIW